MSTIEIGTILQNQTDSQVCCVEPGEAVEVTGTNDNGAADVEFFGEKEACYLYAHEVARLTQMVEEEEDESEYPALSEPEVEVTMDGSEVFIVGTGPAVAQVVYALTLAASLR